MNYLLIAALGGCTGLRCMTPIAVLCWFAYKQQLHLVGWRSFTVSIISVIIFTVMALGELIGDKLPNTPARTAIAGLSGRAVFGAFVAVILAQPLVLNVYAAAALGLAGGVAGAFIGWFTRTRCVAGFKCMDWPVAVTEDVITIALSITLMHLAAVHSLMFAGNEGTFLR